MSAPVLIVGNYPPVETAATPATLDAVRRTWAEGRDAIVVAPRYSAADRTAPVDGLTAGLCLLALRRSTGARHLVLSAEPGMPVHHDGSGGVRRSLTGWVTCAGVAWAMRSFGSVTVIESGFGPDAVPGWRLVRRSAARVVERPEARGRSDLSPTLAGADLAEQRRLLARAAVRTSGKRLLGPAAPLTLRVLRGVLRRLRHLISRR